MTKIEDIIIPRSGRNETTSSSLIKTSIPPKRPEDKASLTLAGHTLSLNDGIVWGRTGVGSRFLDWIAGSALPILARGPSPHISDERSLCLGLTHILYCVLCWFGLLDPGFIPRNRSSLIAATNLAGLLISAFAFVKAYVNPTHPNDRKFSGSSIYDFYMRIELNPRIGDKFDLKLFSNGRPGMIAWTLMQKLHSDISNMAYQYQNQQYIEPSLILVTILQTLYVVDFFVHESWYLRTIDIAHDHYGFYLAWGCFCFLPTTYTIQGQYLGMYSQSPSNTYLAIVFTIGLAGYALFRSVNNQKDKVRRSNGRCQIWGKPAEYIVAAYKTSDGKEHKSLLLCSGWWGFSRHVNYVGDLLLSFSSCALVSSTKVVVWVYAIWMTLILVHRCLRDKKRCSVKYGAAWTEYCRRVPWRFVPGIW
ncbi:hypothetical protein CJF30_00005384 [Rutstroemia sp. NJR-2017a BBW]|nr:hypothetical protein CJF30_00005384 [Rutstroemia sp. NJR-2017a BBW]